MHKKRPVQNTEVTSLTICHSSSCNEWRIHTSEVGHSLVLYNHAKKVWLRPCYHKKHQDVLYKLTASLNHIDSKNPIHGIFQSKNIDVE